MSDSYIGKGFWSYVRQDDEAESGRISKLAKDVVDQYELLTGDEIELFLDQDEIKWGDKWREKIDGSLASVMFFIPVLTPRYFKRPECRRELQFFARQADKLGLRELLLPLYYVDIQSFNKESEDDLISMVCEFHYEDWRDLRLADVNSEEYRRGVAKLAERLVEANKRAEEASIDEAALEVEGVADKEGDAALGTIDRMAIMEETLPKWGETINEMTDQIEIVGEMAKTATLEINKGGVQGGFSGRRSITRRLAQNLDGPANRILMLANQSASQLRGVDDGLRAIIEHAPVEITENPESRRDYCNFFSVIQKLSEASNTGLSGVQKMIDTFAPIEKMSRDLRPRLRRLRQALTTFLETIEVTDRWVSLIEASDVDCRELGNGTK